MKKVFLSVLVFAVLLLSAVTPGLARKDTIILVENPWTASSLNVNVARWILEEEMGYKVDIILLDESVQWAPIGAGDAHASLEVWPSGHQANVEQYIKRLGVVVDGGPLGPIGKIGWYIPSYMLEDYPELATWEGLANKDIAALFSTAETGKKGRFLAGAPGWTQYDEQIIANLGLNLEVVYAGSEEAMLAAVEAAYRRQNPILFYFWTPHSIHAEYDLVEVALPEYTDECYDGVAEGEKSNVACDYPADVLFKIFWGGLEEAYPEVFTFLSNMHYTTEDQISMVAAVDLDGLTPEEAAKAWIEDHEEVWRTWLPESQ